jgi:hypothetical protein
MRPAPMALARDWISSQANPGADDSLAMSAIHLILRHWCLKPWMLNRINKSSRENALIERPRYLVEIAELPERDIPVKKFRDNGPLERHRRNVFFR